MDIKTLNKVEQLIHDGYIAVKNNDMAGMNTARGKLIVLLIGSEDLKTALSEFDKTMYYYYNTFYCL